MKKMPPHTPIQEIVSTMTASKSTKKDTILNDFGWKEVEALLYIYSTKQYNTYEIMIIKNYTAWM